jgi:hypothetical protein
VSKSSGTSTPPSDDEDDEEDDDGALPSIPPLLPVDPVVGGVISGATEGLGLGG